MRVGQARKRDRNEGLIVAALRQVGCRVHPVSSKGFPDLVVYSPRFGLLLMEVKSSHGRQTDAQRQQAAEGWPMVIVRSVPEALAAVGIA